MLKNKQDTNPHAMINQTFSHYKILEKIGEGGMGEVYLAEDSALDRKVALKFLPPHYTSDAEFNKRFQREAKAAAALNHPNIITVHEIGEFEGRAFIAMEYVAGEALRERVSSGQLSVDSAVDIAIQICDGLNAAHQAGIIHRDIKPENIIIDKSGRVRILDFGLAGMAGVSKLTREGTTLGTVSYVSPEQFKRQPVDHRADICAVGVVLYEMLAGMQPFQGEHEHAVMYSVCNEEPEPLSSLRNDVPQELAAVLCQALVKNADMRYQHVDEMLADLFSSQQSRQSEIDIKPTIRKKKRSGYLSAGTGIREKNLFKRPGLMAAVIVILAFLTVVVWRFVPGNSLNDSRQVVKIKPLTSFLGNTIHPSWSPDGSMFAYGHTEKGDMNIYVKSVGEGEPHQLTDNPADELNASWSPKGDKIAYFSDRGKGTEIFWIPPTGGREHRLTNTYIPFLERGSAWFIGLGVSPWSSDSKELLFHRMESTGETAIWKIDVDTRKETQLTFPGPGTRDYCATWSPDGEWIAFDRNERGISSIWMIPAGGGEEQVVISDEFTNFKAAWTPDSRKLLFCSSRSGFMDIWEMDIGSKALRQLTNNTGVIFSYDISESGKVAYYQGGHQTDLYRGEIGRPYRRNIPNSSRSQLLLRFPVIIVFIIIPRLQKCWGPPKPSFEKPLLPPPIYVIGAQS